jgi:hypothetical protein
VRDVLGAARKGRKRFSSVEIGFDELDTGSLEGRVARSHQGHDPIAPAKLRQGSARDVAATDDQ